MTACFPLVCCPWQPYYLLLSLSSFLVFSFFFFFLPFASCKPNYISLMYILTTFLSSPAGPPTISPSLSSAPESCGVSSRFLSSHGSHDFLFPPNDHLFYSPSPSAPTASLRQIPSRSLFPSAFKKKKKKSSLSSWSLLAPSSLPLSSSEWVCR